MANKSFVRTVPGPIQYESGTTYHEHNHDSGELPWLP